MSFVEVIEVHFKDKNYADSLVNSLISEGRVILRYTINPLDNSAIVIYKDKELK